MNGDFHSNGQTSISNQSTPVRNPTQQQQQHQQQRSIFTKSSEDLLKDYGLDFSKLSMVNNINFEGAAAVNKPAPVTSTKPNKDVFDIFADLDPLQPKNFAPAPKSTMQNLQTLNFDPLAPVAPPRTKKSSTESWTTFD